MFFRRNLTAFRSEILRKIVLFYVLAVFLNQPLPWCLPKIFIRLKQKFKMFKKEIQELLPTAKMELFVTIIYGSKPYVKVLLQGVLSWMLIGDLDLLLITMVLSKILRQLKTCVLYFSFIQQMMAMKNVFASSKKFFLFSRYLNFCISDLISPHPPLPRSLLWGWLKINLKVYDVINA